MTASEILTAFRALPLHRRHEAMRVACSYALEAWERYARDGGPIEYRDSVVGMRHMLDMGLPLRAIEAVDRELAGCTVDPAPIWNAYTEPISALQDGDLDLPDPIALHYYAIYNLFGFVFDRCKLYDDGELVIRQAATGDGFLEEWWTRTWDAWASRPVPAHAPSELDAATFDALATGDIARAVATCPPNTRLHAALLALAGRTSEAVAVAAQLLGCDADGWLSRHVLRVAATDALAVDRHATRYAAIHGNRYVVRDVDGHRLRLSGTCGFTLRRVAFGASIIVLAGDVADDIGAYKTIVVGEELDSPDHGYRAEHRGGRQVVALGPKAEIASASDSEVGVLTNRGYERLGDGKVTGAAFSDDGDYLCTYAGPTVAVWRRTTRRCVLAIELGSAIWHAMVAGDRLLLACREATAHVVDLALLG